MVLHISPKNFSSEKNPEITHTVTSNGSRPLHHLQIQTRRHSGRLFKLPQRKNHHAPNLHTVAPSLRNCSFPPSGLTGHSSPQHTEYSQIWLSLFWASVRNSLKPKKIDWWNQNLENFLKSQWNGATIADHDDKSSVVALHRAGDNVITLFMAVIYECL